MNEFNSLMELERKLSRSRSALEAEERNLDSRFQMLAQQEADLREAWHKHDADESEPDKED